MSANLSAHDVIASALSLSEEDRLVVMDAIHVSLCHSQCEQGAEEDLAEVQTAWKNEISQRVADITSGRVQTIPAEEAERMICADARPDV